MYPFKSGQIYAYNQWYIAAWSHEIGRELTSRTILGIPLVMYRTDSGSPVALADRCPHRNYPLSKGTLIGNELQCGYHGIRFDSTGRCVAIPSQNRIPSTYAARAYPVYETWQWIWIWMGDESLADVSRIPNSTMLKLDAPGWVGTVGGTVHLQCRYQVLNENLLDLTHLTFLHRGSIGDEMLASAEPHVTETPAGLEIVRHVKSAQMDHLPVGKAIGIKGPIDRTMRQQFFPPSLHSTGSDYDSAAADGSEPGKHFGAARFLHGVTPETPTTTLYFWAFARNFRLDPEFTKTFHAMVSIAVTEDVDALQSIEALLDDRLVEPVERISTRADMGALRGRRMVGVQIENETAARGLPERSATSGDDLAVDLHS